MIIVETSRQTLQDEREYLIKLLCTDTNIDNRLFIHGAIQAIDWINSGELKPSEFLKEI